MLLRGSPTRHKEKANPLEGLRFLGIELLEDVFAPKSFLLILQITFFCEAQ